MILMEPRKQNKVTLYRVQEVDIGSEVKFEPWIPDGADGEDHTVKRIPVCASILNCLRAMEVLSKLSGRNPDKFKALTEKHTPVKLWVYTCEVDITDIIICNNDQVPDAFNSTEMWLTKPTVFTRAGCIWMRRLIDVSESCYSKYGVIFSPNADSDKMDIDWSLVPDRYTSWPVYGEWDAFAYVNFNPARIDYSITEAAKKL